ncbi:MAG TPA: lipoyl(octanoyl) transferase LipB [Flavisolibacter sp.]
MKNSDVLFEDLGRMGYQQAWDYQEVLLQNNVRIKKEHGMDNTAGEFTTSTTNHLLFVEHPPVYTIGKSGKMEHVLISEADRIASDIEFFRTNRGGDITFHGPGQLVGYPVLDLEKFYTDIGRYLRELEEVVIITLKEFGIVGGRSAGETGVWLDAGVSGRERKICAMGVRCSRWITMHGLALNVNTDLSYFDHIIPCGIQNKKVTSMKAELGMDVEMAEVKEALRHSFERVFNASLL